MSTITIIASIMQMNPILSHVIMAMVIILIFIGFYLIQYKKYTKRYSKSSIYDSLQEKKLLNQLIDDSPDSMFYKDIEGKYLIVNRHFCLIMGIKDPRDMIGKTDFDFYDKKTASKFHNEDLEIIKNRNPILDIERINHTPKGVEIYSSTSKIPIIDNKSNVIGLIGISRDISKEKKALADLEKKSDSLREINIVLEERQEEIQQMAEELNAQTENLKAVNEQLEKLSFVASKTANVVVIMDGNANFEWVNIGFTETYGMNLEEFRKINGNNLRDNSANPNISAILNEVYRTKKSFTYNALFTDVKGQEKWFQSNISPILDDNNEIQNLILIDSDITSIKHAEQQINVQKEEIESQAEALQKTNSTKDRLFSIIAHDLKNPFHSIMGFSDLLQTKHKELDPDKMQEYLSLINTSTHSAYDLLENLLDWARTQTNRTQYKPEITNVKECVDRVIDLLSLHAVDKKIILSNEVIPDISVYADENMLRTIIRNLTGNAIKYTNENGSITFAAYADKDNTYLEIVDTGIGMKKDKIKDLYNLDKISSTAGTSGETGTGLGLIVCYEFMQINGGTIGVKSQPGKGTSFKLTFPAHKKEA